MREQLFLERVVQWASDEEKLLAVALVGSRTRGNPRPDSDVDIVLFTEDPGFYLKNMQWTAIFGDVVKISDEDWGAVQSKRVLYKDGLEVEFGVTTKEWAKTNPIDAGTNNVIRNGMKILYDRIGILRAVMDAVAVNLRQEQIGEGS
jgi:uncharacterized protein